MDPTGTHHLLKLQQQLPSIFLGRGERNPLYQGTLGLCAAVSAANFMVDTRVILTRAGGNRFGIEAALEDQEQMSNHCKLSRYNIKQGRYYTLLSSVFNHSSLAHLMGNMWGLYNSGRMLRPVPFMIVFYGGALAGNLLCLALDARTGRVVGSSLSGTKIRAAGLYLGASGGVSALMAFMSCLYPTVSVTMYSPFPLTLPFWMHTVVFAGYCCWAELSDLDEDIAHLGHLGGLIWGVLYYVGKFRRLPWV